MKKGVKDHVDAEVNYLCMWCQSLYHICSKKQLDDALKHIDDVKKGVKDHVDAEVNY